jgi:hypothetical protein
MFRYDPQWSLLKSEQRILDFQRSLRDLGSRGN